MDVNELLDVVFKLIVLGCVLGAVFLCGVLVLALAYAPVA